MKFWNEKAGDHSANLRIVGTFRTPESAQEAARQVNSLIEVASKAGEIQPKDSYAKEVLDFMRDNDVSYSPEAVASCTLHDPVTSRDRSIEVRTDDLEIQVFIEAFIRCGGKIEIYSLHEYK